MSPPSRRDPMPLSLSDEQVVIVGGGLSGLATAQSIVELARARRCPVPRLTILEAADHVGGTIRTSAAEGFVCEQGPAGFLDREPRTLELCRQLELGVLRARAAAKNRYLFAGGALRAVPASPRAFLASPLLSWPAKLRLAAEPLVPRRPSLARDESVASFARRRIGDEAYRTLIDAMQSGIFAGDAEQLSVAACFPRVVEVERQYGSLVLGMISLMRKRRRGDPAPGAGPSGTLTSFAAGLQTLTDRLAAVFPGDLRCGAPVHAVEPAGAGGWIVHAADGTHPARAVVLACPTSDAAGLLAAVDRQLAAVLQEIDYAPMAVICLGFARDAVAHALDGFGFLAPRHEGLRLLGAQFCSAMFGQHAPPGHELIRAMVGGARDRGAVELDDAGLCELALADLDRAVGLRGAPALQRVFRWAQAIPQYTLGHRARLARIDALLHRHPRLLLTGNGYRGIGINDCVRNAWGVAAALLDALAQR